MSLLERIFSEPELREHPPVLVDVGAAGGAHPAWRRIARWSIGVGFEPDTRDAAVLDGEQRRFRRWVFCPAVAVPHEAPGGRAVMHLTRSPHCSSLLPPLHSSLGEWVMAGYFEPTAHCEVPATTLAAALAGAELGRIDWMKLDTQGLDLALWRSVPAVLRAGVLALEFEPGLVDVYEGEDKLPAVLEAMAAEPYWLAAFEVGRMPRARPEQVARALGARAVRRLGSVGVGAPAWTNLRYLRNVDGLDRRGLLLAWVFGTLSGQHGYALGVAEEGRHRYPGPLFCEMSAASTRRLRWQIWRGVPGYLCRRLRRLWPLSG